MPNLDIGLSGLQVAQAALETVGTNIANASTPGYHKQSLQIAPLDLSGQGVTVYSGVTVAGVTRSIDSLTESEILRQTPLQGQVTTELTTLQSIEQSMGSIDSQGLLTAINSFVSSMNQLASQPDSVALRQQMASAADEMAQEFNTQGQSLTDLDGQIVQDAQNTCNQANGLIDQIASLNVQVEQAVTHGNSANVLKDQRDQAVKDLAGLVNVQVDTQSSSDGMVNVVAWGTPLVLGSSALHLQASSGGDDSLILSLQGGKPLQGDLQGGTLGGLVNLKNNLVAGLKGNLDTLATQLAAQINQAHVQGIGADGSFTSLDGTKTAGGTLGSWNAGITAGNAYVRVTNVATGATEHFALRVNPATDTLNTIAGKLNALQDNGVQVLTASVADSTLHLQAAAGYQFDFSPALDSQPTTSTLSGTSSPTVSGAYTGDSDQTYTFTVHDAGGTGTVGLSTGLTLDVTNAAGELVKTLSVGGGTTGQGYAAGDPLEVDNGISVALGAGTLTDGQQFTVQALANSDPTGFLSAAGMNTFFHGDSASTLAVNQDILDDPNRIAASQGPDATGNGNIQQMASVASEPLDALGGLNPVDYYQQMVTNLGEDIQTRQARQASMTSSLQQLQQQADDVGGVDINEEGTELLQYEKMFEAASKYITTADKAMQALNDML